MTHTKVDGAPLVDFDHHSRTYAHNSDATIRALHSHGCPVVRTEAHGGYYVALGYDEVVQIAQDTETFTSWNDLTRSNPLHNGVQIPTAQISGGMIETDGPSHRHYRSIMNGWFSPKSAEERAPVFRAIADSALDALIAKGEGDVIADLAGPVPALATMHLLGLPAELAAPFATSMHAYIGSSAGTPERDAALPLLMQTHGELYAACAAMHAAPTGDGLIAFLCGCTNADGDPMSADDVFWIASLMIAGGLDTTTSLIASALWWLADKPDQQQALLADPRLMRVATEEMLRRFAPVLSLARTVTAPCTVGGVALDTGDRVLLSWGAANLDPNHFPEPEQVRFDRTGRGHVSFGVGMHRCIGSNIARVVFTETIRRTLERMPDYRIDSSQVERYPCVEVSNGYERMPISIGSSAP